MPDSVLSIRPISRSIERSLTLPISTCRLTQTRRPLGSLFAFPDPFEANYGRGGLGRVMTDRGWLSTWSGLSSHAKLADTMSSVTVPTLILHPTADTEIRVRQATEIRDNAGADDVTYHQLASAPHYLEGHRIEATELVVDWLRARFP